MAIPYNTGPAECFVGVGGVPPLNPLNPSSPVYLGTFEAAPDIMWSPEFEPVMNDLSGSRKPYDMIYEGTDAVVQGSLTIWNWPIWERIKSQPNFAAGAPGNSIRGDIGTLMVTEGFAYPLWLRYPHAAKAVFAAAGMVAGHRFVASWLIGRYGESMGTKANRLPCSFFCIRAYDGATGRFILGDNTMTGLPAIPPVSPLGV